MIKIKKRSSFTKILPVSHGVYEQRLPDWSLLYSSFADTLHRTFTALSHDSLDFSDVVLLSLNSVPLLRSCTHCGCEAWFNAVAEPLTLRGKRPLPSLRSQSTLNACPHSNISIGNTGPLQTCLFSASSMALLLFL